MYTGLYQDFNVYMCVCACMRERPDPAFSIVRYCNFHIDLSEIHPCSSEGLQTNLATQNQDQHSEHQKPQKKMVDLWSYFQICLSWRKTCQNIVKWPSSIGQYYVEWDLGHAVCKQWKNNKEITCFCCSNLLYRTTYWTARLHNFSKWYLRNQRKERAIHIAICDLQMCTEVKHRWHHIETNESGHE